MSFPVPLPNTALLADCDGHIRQLANDLDALVNGANSAAGLPGMRYAFQPGAEYTINNAGELWVSFAPKLTTIHGFYVSTPGRFLAKGAISKPPNGSVLPALPVKIVPYTYPKATTYTDPVRVSAFTVSWSNLGSNSDDWYGAQRVLDGTKIPVVGIAWGDPW